MQSHSEEVLKAVLVDEGVALVQFGVESGGPLHWDPKRGDILAAAGLTATGGACGVTAVAHTLL